MLKIAFIFGAECFGKYKNSFFLYVNSKKESPTIERIKTFETPKQLAWLRTGTKLMRDDLIKHAENPVPVAAGKVMSAITETENAEVKNAVENTEVKESKEPEVELPE